MRLEHPIFQGPLEPGIEQFEFDRPNHYANYPAGRAMPERISVWRVHTGEFTKTVDVGLVSDPLGFEDSPDAEWISGGINSKGPQSMALGRNGNEFLWGFAGDATQMTESSKRVFLNAICYMSQFDGKKPLVRRSKSSRDWVFLYINNLRTFADNEKILLQVKKGLLGTIPEDVIEEYGLDADALESYYRSNLEFLRAGDREWGYEVDPDCAELGISNRELALLDQLGERMTADPEDVLSHRVLERYVEESFRSVAEYSAWLNENRAYLFFSDVGGFRWYVDTYAKAEAERAKAEPAGTSR